jgi:hypothetical protein
MDPSAERSKRSARRYRVVAVSLYEEQADAADRITAALQRSGWPKANRSLVIREALMLLADQLGGKSSEEIFQSFVDRYARRAGQLPSSLTNGGGPERGWHRIRWSSGKRDRHFCAAASKVTSVCAPFEQGLAEPAVDAEYIAHCLGAAMPRCRQTTRAGLRR